jgi:hypothetical protein
MVEVTPILTPRQAEQNGYVFLSIFSIPNVLHVYLFRGLASR